MIAALLKPIMIYSGALLIVHALRSALYLIRCGLSRRTYGQQPDKPELMGSVATLYGLALLVILGLIFLFLILP